MNFWPHWPPHTLNRAALFLQSCPFNYLLVFCGCWVPAWAPKSSKRLPSVLLRVPCRVAWHRLFVTKIILLSESIVSFGWVTHASGIRAMSCTEYQHFRGKIHPRVDAEAAHPSFSCASLFVRNCKYPPLLPRGCSWVYIYIYNPIYVLSSRFTISSEQGVWKT